MMLKRFFFIGSWLLLSASCAYKATQPPQFSKLDQSPVVIETKHNYELHLKSSQNRDDILFTTHLIQKKTAHSDDTVVRFAKQEGRLLVGLRTDNNDTLQWSNRKILFKKVPNFRDLGGVQTTEGRTIYWGKLFRSGQLNGLRKSDIKKMEEMDIRTLVDLRTEVELHKKPDKYPTTTTYFHYNAFEDEQEQLAKTRQAVFKGEISPVESVELLKAFYSYYPIEEPEIIKEIIHKVLNQNHAVLFHCSAGKDRTGITAALVLSVLKVDRETIYQEYLLSNNYRQKGIEKQLKLLKVGRLIYPKLNQAVVENFSWVNTDYLMASFAAIESRYGSMDNYIHQVLKITESDRQKYIEKFTY